MNHFSLYFRRGAIAIALGLLPVSGLVRQAGAQDAPAAAEEAPAESTVAAQAEAPATSVEEAPSYNGAEGTKSEIVIEKAIIELDQGNAKEALRLVEEALALKPDEPGLLRLKGVALNALNKPRDAAKVLSGITESHPDYKAHYTPLGSAYLKQEQCDLAIPAFRKGADADSTDGVARYGIGICQFQKGEYKDATQWFEQSAALGTNRNASEYFRALSFYRMEEKDQARTGFQALVDRAPDSTHGKEAKKYIARIDGGEAEGDEDFKLVPSLAVGWSFDSNVGLTPDGELLPTFLKKKGDNRLELSLGLDITTKISDQFRLSGSLSNAENSYLNNTDYNQGVTNALIYGTFETGAKDEEVGVTLAYDYTWFRLGRYMGIKTALADTDGDGVIGSAGDDPTPRKWGIRYGTFSHSHNFVLAGYKRMQEWTFDLRGTMGWERYPSEQIAPFLNNGAAPNNRESMNLGLSAGGTYATKTWMAGTDLGLANRNAKSSQYSYLGLRWNTNAQYLPTKKIALRNGTRLSYSVHGASDAAYCGLAGGPPNTSPCPVDSERKDFSFTWTPEIAFKVSEITEFYMNYALELRTSSLASFEYDRQLIGAGARVRWE